MQVNTGLAVTDEGLIIVEKGSIRGIEDPEYVDVGC
jgi:hypothetical protein